MDRRVEHVRLWGQTSMIALAVSLLIASGCAMGKATGSSSAARRGVAPAATSVQQAQPVPAASPLPETVSLAPAPVAQLTGSWEGVYFVYPQPMGMKVELRSSRGDTVEGTLGFYPLDTHQRHILGTIRGKYTLKGTYDSATQTFELEPGRWIEKPSGLVVAVGLRGVLSRARQELGGFLVSRNAQNFPAKMHFVMSRPQNAAVQLIEPMIDAASTGGRGLGHLFGGTPDGDRLVEWASRLKGEYPDLDFDHTVLGTLLGYARNLFEDEHFQKYFGKTFDRMSPGERASVVDTFRKANQPARRSLLSGIFHGGSNEELKRYAFLAGAFSSTGTDSAPEITLSVLTHRVIRAWRDAVLDRMRDWPAEGDVLRRLATLQTEGKDRLVTLWPSEQKGFMQAVVAAESRVAAPLLMARVDEVLASAKSFQSAQAIGAILGETRSRGAMAPARGQRTPERETVASPTARVPSVDDSVPALMALVSAETRQREVDRLEGKLAALVNAEVNAAHSGETDAMFHLGVAYANGLGVVRSEAEAVRWYMFAAQEGHVQAQVEMARRYEGGIGVAKRPAIAREIYAALADSEDPVVAEVGRRQLSDFERKQAAGSFTAEEIIVTAIIAAIAAAVLHGAASRDSNGSHPQRPSPYEERKTRDCELRRAQCSSEALGQLANGQSSFPMAQCMVTAGCTY